MLDPAFLFSDEIKTSAVKDGSPAISVLSETLKVVRKSKKVEKSESELRIQTPLRIKRQVKTTLPRTEAAMLDRTKLSGLALVFIFDKFETKHTSSKIYFKKRSKVMASVSMLACLCFRLF